MTGAKSTEITFPVGYHTFHKKQFYNFQFIPIKLHERQVKALVNAKSVTDRIFTKEEHAQNHCQIGNIGLALDTMVNWIEEKNTYDKTPA